LLFNCQHPECGWLKNLANPAANLTRAGLGRIWKNVGFQTCRTKEISGTSLLATQQTYGLSWLVGYQLIKFTRKTAVNQRACECLCVLITHRGSKLGR